MEMLIILALAFGAMYLMTSRTRKQQREAADFRANLEIGQEVMTGSGLYGTIVDVDGDTITLESTPGNHTRWIRAAIAKQVTPVEELTDDDVDEDATDDGAGYDEEADGPYDAEYDGSEYDATQYDTTERAEYDPTPDVTGEPGTRPVQRGGATRVDRFDVPDDLSTMDERRPDDGTDRR